MAIMTYWGRRYGGFYSTRKNKQGLPDGLIVKGRRGSTGSRENSVPKRRHHTHMLARNAKALGWLNGERRGGRDGTA